MIIMNTTIHPADINYSSSYSISSENNYEKNKELFWIWALVYLIIAFVAVVGNELVLYAVYGKKNNGRLQYLYSSILSLAVADMLLGFIGIPLGILNAYYSGSLDG